MKTYYEINEKKKTSLALGFFDGVHIAHKKVITTLINEAKLNQNKSAVISFDKNPADYFSEERTLAIHSFKDKEIILENLGLDYFYELDFELYKDMSAYDYLRDVLIKNFQPDLIVVGYDHKFGKNKEGDINFLKEHEQEFHYRLIAIPESKIDGEKVSSTLIRKKIQDGRLDYVKTLLGRNFSVRNSVIKGNGMARNLGYPTINLVWPDSIVKLPFGVYFGYATIDDDTKPALISWGKRPTLTKGEEAVLEAHIYNVDKDLYGKIAKVSFERKIRNEMNFYGIKPLAEQLKKDYELFLKWVSAIGMKQL